MWKNKRSLFALISVILLLLFSFPPSLLGQDPSPDEPVDPRNPEEIQRISESLYGIENPPEATVIEGYTYGFLVHDEHIDITFPDTLKTLEGQSQAATLEGRLELFIESEPEDPLAARMWITNIREEISGLDIFGMNSFTIDTSMLDPNSYNPELPQGHLNLETNEYELTYTFNLTPPPLLAEAGIENLGQIVVVENGLIRLNEAEDAFLVTFGELTISEGPFAGTHITYSPKVGSSAPEPPTKTQGIFLPTWDSCGGYSGAIGGTGAVTGRGVFNLSVGFDYLVLGHGGVDIWFTKTLGTQQSTAWNGLSVNGPWGAKLYGGVTCRSYPNNFFMSIDYK